MKAIINNVSKIISEHKIGGDDPRNGRYHIDPVFAQYLLIFNTDNARAKSESRVKRYAADMKAGKWKSNGETIVIGKDGKLKDGQHRLYACIEADVAFDAYIIFDAEPTNLYDFGSNRRQKNIFDGLGIKTSTLDNSIGTTLFKFVTGSEDLGVGASQEFTSSNLSTIQEASRIVSVGRARSKAGAKACCGAVVAALLKTGDMKVSDIEMFFHVVNSRNVIGCVKDPSPAFTLLNQFENAKGGGRATQKLHLEATYQALMDFKDGKIRQKGYSTTGNEALEYIKKVFGAEKAAKAA